MLFTQPWLQISLCRVNTFHENKWDVWQRIANFLKKTNQINHTSKKKVFKNIKKNQWNFGEISILSLWPAPTCFFRRSAHRKHFQNPQASPFPTRASSNIDKTCAPPNLFQGLFNKRNEKNTCTKISTLIKTFNSFILDSYKPYLM